MFFDALNPLFLKGFRAFYVFCPVLPDFRSVSRKPNSGTTLPKDKAASRRQYKQYGKANTATPYFGKGRRYGSTLPKDKATSRRQYKQYGKARPTTATPYFGKGGRYK